MRNGQALFFEAAERLCEPIRTRLKNSVGEKAKTAQEIRLIEGIPPQIMVENRIITLSGEAVTANQLAESVITLCENAVHSHSRELAQGYITIKGGHRAGISATAVYDENGNLTGLRKPTAIVLRIARSFENVSNELIKRAFCDGICGLLIAGAPASGKTTMLKDLARRLSQGAVAGCERVAVVDERGELSGFCGAACVMNGYQKAQGMLIAVRNLSPQVIICDELGSTEEIKAVQQVLNSGVAVITSVHAADREELLQKSAVMRLLRCGAFAKTAFLSQFPHPCSIKEVVDTDALLNESGRCFADNSGLLPERNITIKTVSPKGECAGALSRCFNNAYPAAESDFSPAE